MARKEVAIRQFTIYFPSRSDLLRWKKLSYPNPLNKWIYETIEQALEGRSVGTKDTSELNALRTENVELKDKLKIITERLHQYELREDRRSSEEAPLFYENIIALLKAEDKYWSIIQIREYLLEHLSKDDLSGVSIGDISRSIRIVIDDYQRLGFISITGKGIRWIG